MILYTCVYLAMKVRNYLPAVPRSIDPTGYSPSKGRHVVAPAICVYIYIANPSSPSCRCAIASPGPTCCASSSPACKAEPALSPWHEQTRSVV